MPLPAAAIFDNDGLTLNTEIVWTRAEVTLFARRGRDFTHEHKLDLVGSAGPVAAGKLARMLDAPADDGPAILAELNELVVEELRKGCDPMPGAVDLLAALRSRDVPLALCSNSPRRIVDLALAGGGLEAAFDLTISIDDVAVGKPAPDPYLAVAAALGIPPRDCTALEDSPTGVASARAAGMRVIGIPSVPGVDLGDDADMTFASLEDPALLRLLGVPRGARGQVA